jgi:hypothetical protein
MKRVKRVRRLGKRVAVVMREKYDSHPGCKVELAGFNRSKLRQQGKKSKSSVFSVSSCPISI